jgi:hypothetical protein
MDIISYRTQRLVSRCMSREAITGQIAFEIFGQKLFATTRARLLQETKR